MRLGALAKSIMFYDISDVFHVLPGKTIIILESKLELLFDAQNVINQSNDTLAADPSNTTSRKALADAITAKSIVVVELEGVPLAPTDLLKQFKGIEVHEVRVSNSYFAKYGSEASVETLAWCMTTSLIHAKRPSK